MDYISLLFVNLIFDLTHFLFKFYYLFSANSTIKMNYNGVFTKHIEYIW